MGSEQLSEPPALASGGSGPVAHCESCNPEGCRESSRWSKRSVDHRKPMRSYLHPGGVPVPLHKRYFSSYSTPACSNNSFSSSTNGAMKVPRWPSSQPPRNALPHGRATAPCRRRCRMRRPFHRNPSDCVLVSCVRWFACRRIVRTRCCPSRSVPRPLRVRECSSIAGHPL